MIKIALVDDHVVLRKSLAVLITMLHDFEVVIQAGNGREFIKHLSAKPFPDIVLMDITMPEMDGVETTLWLKQNHPSIKVIVLSMLRNELVVIRMLKNGARGFLLKDMEPEELHSALQQVHHQGYYYNTCFTREMQLCNRKKNRQTLLMMNEQELVFLKWICTEKSHKQIAVEMCVSPRTVDGYRDALFRKLNVSSRAGMVMYALKNEIVLL